MKKQFLSIFLIIILLFGVMPIHVHAESNKYGTFVSGEKVIEDMIAYSGQNAHPRLIMTNDKFAALKKYVKKDSAGNITIDKSSVTGKLLIELKDEADGYAKSIESKKFVEYNASSEDHLLEASKKVQRHVATLALAYNIFDEDRYARCAYAELEHVCNTYKDWSPGHFLDTAEMCTAFAYGYDWLYNWMDQGQRDLLRENMIENGLNQVMNDYEGKVKYAREPKLPNERTYDWYYDGKEAGDNWQLVCTGGTDLVALAIGDETDAKALSAKALNYGYKRAYDFVRRAYDTTDGTYIEGLGYWDYATYYLGLHSSALISATGKDYGLADHEGVKKSAEFVHYMSSNYPYSFSFGDDRDSRDTGWAVFLWLGDYLNSPGMSAIRLQKIYIGYEFNYLDVLWIDESKQNGDQLSKETDWGVVGGSNATFRTSWSKDGLVAALHTGKNDAFYHGHFDLGSFYVESNGSRFFTDIGNEPFYLLTNRAYSYRINSEGHNTLTINPPKNQLYYGQKDKMSCYITEYKEGNEAYAVTDLSETYTEYDAKKVIRGLKMIKDKNCVIVQDEISLNNPGEIYWFAHTKGEININSDGKSAIVTVGSDRLWVGLLSDGKFTKMLGEPLPTSENVEGATSARDYKKLVIHLTNVKDTTISVVCIPLKSGDTKPSWIPSIEEISKWSVEGDTHTHSGIKVDKVNPTCTKAGVKEYYKCECGKLFEDAACTKEITDSAYLIGDDALGHDFTGDFDGFDAENHWKICNRKDCDSIDMKAPHYGGNASLTNKAVCAACGQEYGEALKVPVVKAPVVKASVTYNPNKTLADYALEGTNATYGGKTVAGSWAWKNDNEIPIVSKKKYTAVFTPKDLSIYVPVEAEVSIDVKKAVAEITTVPTASEITYGQSIADSKISGGKASVKGSFAWAADDVVLKPTVEEANSKTYTIEFRPNDSVNYNVATTEVKVKVNKAENAPNMPATSINPAFDIDKVSKNSLPDDWKWADKDENANLQAGVPYVASAIYDGLDAGNYVNETVLVTITRSTCNHDADSEIRDAKEATCSEEGYTGDEYCKKCNELIKAGQSIATIAHTGGTATCTKLKKCIVCGSSYGEVNPNNHVETEVRGKKQATCTEDGYSGDTYCKACNALIKQGNANSKATGHNYERIVTTEPTYDDDGLATYTCKACKDEYTEKIDKRPLDIPCLKGNDKVRGWEDIKNYIKENNQVDYLEIEMNGNFIVPTDLLETLAGKNIEITFKATFEANEYSWTIKGSDLSAENIVDVDIRNVPEDNESGNEGTEGSGDNGSGTEGSGTETGGSDDDGKHEGGNETGGSEDGNKEGGSEGEGVEPGKPPVKPAPKPDEPNVKPDKPEVKPDQPEVKPNKPEVKPDQPEVKPNKPEVKPDQPEVKPDKPEVKPDQPEVKPNKPEVKPDQPEVKPNKPEEKPNITEQKPTNPEQNSDKLEQNPANIEQDSAKKDDSLQLAKQETKLEEKEEVQKTDISDETKVSDTNVSEKQLAVKEETTIVSKDLESATEVINKDAENGGSLKLIIFGIIAAATVACAAVAGLGVFLFKRRR